jgi:hypothetical protein
MNQSAYLDKSPNRVSNTWANNSALDLTSKSTSQLALPEKLLKMKERVQRDRSAN